VACRFSRSRKMIEAISNLVVVDNGRPGEQDEAGGDGAVEGERRHRPVARGQHGRHQHNRMLGWNGRSDAGRRKTNSGGIAGAPCSGAGRRILPPGAALLSLRAATATQGCPRAALLFGFGTVDVRAPRFLPGHRALTRRHTLNSIAEIISSGARPNTNVSSRGWGLSAVPPGPNAVVRIPAARPCPGSGDDASADPARRPEQHGRCTLHRQRSRARGFAAIRFARSR